MPSKQQIEREKEVEENTRKMIEEDGCFLYYSNIDYLTIKLTEGSEIVEKLKKLSVEEPKQNIPGGEFYIRFESIIHEGGLSILRIYDTNQNKVGCVHIKNRVLNKDGVEKANKNTCTDVEFTGDFWKLYSEKFPYLCKYFCIDPEREKNVTRMDYCMDIAGIDVQEFYDRYRSKTMVGDAKPARAEHLGNLLTGWTDVSDRHEMQIYNKKLDILNPKKKKHKIKSITGERPYLPYIKEEFEITRAEYRIKARALRECSASVNYCFNYCQQLMTGYTKKFYKVDLSKMFETFERKEYPKREDKIVPEMINKKAYMAGRMIEAYCSNLSDYKTESDVFKLLHSIYGDRLQEHLFRNYPTEKEKSIWKG